MPPQKRAPCQICSAAESKYACAQCSIVYCSIACYKAHKASSCRAQPQPPSHDSGEQHAQGAGPFVVGLGQQPSQAGSLGADQPASVGTPSDANVDVDVPLVPLRPLTSLKWPYVPEESAYPDPLKRDDPKPLQLHQYEAIATSPTIRRTLSTHPQLPVLLRRIDALRGPAREAALERALGVADPHEGGSGVGGMGGAAVQDEEDKQALRGLAEAVEAVVRGGREGLLGLDWGD
ncbi:uncharacterized protein C8Q71DRAFT_846779 [Rhodofomes roseus]|uniref:HIT-type domain-containing protein n=1 Tax=Rhodofomes roseus TaxID=34475 RepID=A0ABQ8KLK9_9APHY|nr:uncharacterized protein C8Q71DRAFT_846779 [Rhodofomes roseus]KAH9839096.1 hypothetical protein C8Q71DRAFT_846779 [Rhodofomes roseus]